MTPVLRRRIFVITVITVAVALTVYGFIPKAVEVELAAAKKGTLQVTIEEEGRTRLKDRFTVSAPVPGFLQRIDLKVGDAIKKGQAVAQLEPLRSPALDPRSHGEARAAVSAAEAAVRAAEEREQAARADADYAGQRHERMKTLFQRGTIARDTLDQAEADAKRAGANRSSAAAAVGVARSDLERARTAGQDYSSGRGTGSRGAVSVTSPVAGRVFKVYRESESAVQQGEPLLDIGSQADLEVRVEVLSSDAVQLRKGMRVEFKRWGGDQPLMGTVRIIEPAGFTKISSLGVEEQRVLVLVDITSAPEQWQALGDGYRLDTTFIVWEGKDILQVPASALFRSGQDWAVFVADSGRAVKRIVQVGKRSGLTAEILSGLKDGEKVIARPDDTVKEGGKVKAAGR
ncbi:MAG: efflux transporter periplasmic adaptor subunit [Deltaproteobacteria bacterium HGW-Deltaproteobacteria-19]|nr:MAG: efflux transporter periplasmic adaptor subunit [Deltaproteobacteria bacterium HGW-Deltaproteobacteria-19]